MAHMERALALACEVLGTVSPNPAVGAVVVKDGDVVGEGATQRPGGDHAEVVALRQADARAKGATLYTTLEPCNHQGRTPPCTDAIIDSGVVEVRAAVTDPNPQVVGGGLKRLQEAGIETHRGECEADARRVLEGYLHYVQTGLPFVTVKFAMSLDGKIATHTGESKWISGPESRRFVHQLRGQSDAIVTGINTVLADDPRLTARDGDDEPLDHQPLRVVVDSRGRLPRSAAMLAEPGRTLVAIAHPDDGAIGALNGAGAEVLSVAGHNGGVDLAEVMSTLGKQGAMTALVEAGGELIGSLFDDKQVSKVVAFVSPTIIGGQGAPSPVGGLGAESLAEALHLSDVEVRRFGPDVAIIGYV